MNSCELVTLISSVACTIGKCHEPDDLALIGSMFTQLGDTLTTMSLHKDLCSKTSDPKK